MMGWVAYVMGFMHGIIGWVLLIIGGLIAVSSGIATLSPNGGSLLGVLIALWGAYLIMRREV